MHKIQVHKDKLTYNTFNDKKNTWKQTAINDESGPISRYFNVEVEICEDVRFEDFMNLMERFENDINFCFASFSKMIPLKTYLQELRTDITHEIEIAEVELFRKGEVVSHEVNIVNSMHGFMSEKSAEELGESIDKTLSIDTYHVNALKRSHLTINESIVYVDYGNPSDDDMGDTEKILFSGYCKWTLQDLISTVLSVLTQNGTPEERDTVNSEYEAYDFKKVAKSKEDIEMWMSLFSEEIAIRKAEKIDAIEDERYEEASILTVTIEELEEKIKDLKGQIPKIKEDQQVV